MNLVQKYYHWLHGQWPAGKVEQLPDVDERGRTNLPGVYVVGDLNGVPLLKFSAQTGQDAVKEIILNKKNSVEKDSSEELDLAIIGSGVSGVSAAIAAKEAGLNFKIFESNETFSTIVNFPKGKPIFTYPTDMKPEGPFDFDQGCDTKENLLSHLQKQFKQAKIKVDKVYIDEIEKRGNYYKLKSKEQEFQSKNVIIAIGRSGNYRKMNVPGEEMDKVYNRLFDPAEFKEKKVTVVGGGDSAVEAAISLYQAGAEVTLSYRNKDLTRPKPENTEKIYSLASGQEGKNSENKKGIDLKLGSKIKKITEAEVEIESAEGENLKIKNDVVFALIGREAPLQFFRKSGIRLLGELSTKSKALMLLFISFCVWIYHWKGYYFNHLDPAQWVNALKSSQGFSLLTSALNAPANLLGTIAISLESRSFYYTLLYCSCIVFFGIRRMIDKKTPYIKLQTWTLISIQCLPLFILPEIIFPWMGHNGFLITEY